MASAPEHGVAHEEPAPARARAVSQPLASSHASPAARVLALQRAAGNAATTRLLAGRALMRKPLTEEQRAVNLKAPRYAGDPELEAAYDNAPVMKPKATGPAVEKVQQGLIDAGIQLPKGTIAGITNGIYDAEMVAAVKKFQAKHKLNQDGRVGRMTLGKLDELALANPGKAPEIANNEGAIGAYITNGMVAANGNYSPTSGIYYDYNYFAAYKAEPDKYAWKDDWRDGYASEAHFERVGWMDWRLKPGVSASEGIKAWLKGLTIAECLATIVAIQIDALRACIGDDAFDARFGSTKVAVPEQHRLRVRAGVAQTPVGNKLKKGEAVDDPGEFGKRNFKPGDWTYFYNHPKYLLKHPGGAWQGENAVYQGTNAAGEQIFSGLGATDKTETAMHKEMVGAYNQARDGADYVALLERFAPDAPEVKKPNRLYLDRDLAYTKSLYEKYKDKIPAIYREDSGEFADEIKIEDVTKAPAYKIDDRERLGGLFNRATYRLDPDKIARLRSAP